MAAVAVLTIIGIAIVADSSSERRCPSFKELSMLINVKAVPGTSQPEMSRITGRMGNELRKVDGIRNVGAHIGRAVMGDQIVDVNSAELWVSIDPKANYNKTAKAIKATRRRISGTVSYTVQTYLREKSGDVILEPEDKVVVRVYGDKYDVLGSTAKEIDAAIAEPRELKKPRVKMPIQEAVARNRSGPGRGTKARPQAGRRSPGRRLPAFGHSGRCAVRRSEEFSTWSCGARPKLARASSSINNLMIDAPGGTRVRLGDVAKVRIVPRPALFAMTA